MEKKEKDPIQTFDTLYTTNQIQIMKILLPFCDVQTRRSLVVMIKFMELQYTVSFAGKHPDAFQEAPLPFSLGDVCEQIKAYCPPQLRSMLEQFQSMQNALKMYEEMKQMMELFQDGTADDTNPFASLMGMSGLMSGAAAAAESSGSSEPSGSLNPSGSSEPSASTEPSGSAEPSESSEPSDSTGSSGPFSPFGSSDPMSMLLSFLSPDQQELFRMLSPGPGSPDTQTAGEESTDACSQTQTTPP